jgi:hypothetical protein
VILAVVINVFSSLCSREGIGKNFPLYVSYSRNGIMFLVEEQIGNRKIGLADIPAY